jgi:Uma2 family endonuclease
MELSTGARRREVVMVETMPVAEPETLTESPPQTALELEEVVEGRVIRMLDHPITFDEWLDICGPKDFHELIDGVLVEKPMVQWEHEKAERWLDRVLGSYVDGRELGAVACSRSPVHINNFRGRLPDLFFVRRGRMEIVQEKATYGTPDFVAEIVSPNDRPSHLSALEADYRNLGVPEIWFIDLPRQRLRMLRKQDGGYDETVLTEGDIGLEAVPGFAVRVEWLLREPRPKVPDVLAELLSHPPAD